MKKKHLLIFIFTFVYLMSSFAASPTASKLTATWQRSYKGHVVAMKLKADNTFSFGILNGPSFIETIKGNFTSTDSTITFSNQSGAMEACPGVKCVYKYNINGNSITLAVSNDPCAARVAKVGGAWIK